jgi:hypothetical protein
MLTAEALPGNVIVSATQGRGWTPEELAERLVDRIVGVADTAPEPIRAQAHAFKDRLRPLCVFYLRQAAQSDRTTLYNQLRDAGFPDAAEAIRRL